MPIAPRFHITHILDLALQIKRAPEKVRLRQIQLAEELLWEIEEDTLYPLDYLVFRMTKYRSDAIEQPMLLGSALRGDLVSLIAVVSRTINIPATGMLSVEGAAKFLLVSTRTISRLRKEGLVLYWVVEESGRKRLGCTEQMLKLFQEQNEARMRGASAFSRLSKIEQKTLVQSALEYKGSGRSLNSIAKELASNSGRGHETIRSLLFSADETKQALKTAKPLSTHDAKVIEGARQRGVPWRSLEDRFQRSPGAMRKSVARLRARRLKQMRITFVDLEVFLREDAEGIILGSPIVRNLIPPVLTINPMRFGFDTDLQVTSDEIAMVSAMHLLKRRAKLTIAQLGYAPSEYALDRIETDLRWVYLLQQHLLLFAIKPSIAVAVQHVGRPLSELQPSKAISLVQQVIAVVGEACGSLDPSKGQSTISTPASIVDRVLSSEEPTQMSERVATRMKTPSLELPFYQIVPWSFLFPNREPVDVDTMHLGWGGFPKTAIEIAEELGKSVNWVSRRLQ